MIETIKRKVRELIALDYRSLALMRMGIALTLIFDLIQRLENLYVFYDDRGILPRSVLFEKFGGNFQWSLHAITGMWQLELILFIVALIVAFALLIGYRTTLATVVSWILLVSVQNRNPMILQGGDVIFRVVLFWCIFLPWGRYMSIDSVRNNFKLSRKTISNIATAGYIIAIVSFYFFSGMLKTGMQWHDGSAVYYALSIDQLTTSFGHFLLGFPKILSVLTFSVLYLELYGSLLLLSPYFTKYIRTIVVLLFALMQIGLNISMHLGLFGMISVVITLGLLPSYFWDTIVRSIRNSFSKKEKRVTVYYDADCGFCKKCVMLLKRLLWLPESVLILKSTDDESITKEMELHNSWIVIGPDGTHYYKSQALQVLLRASPVFWWKSYFYNIRGFVLISDYIYEKIASGRNMICLPDEIQEKKLPNALVALITFLLVFTVFFNIETLGKKNIIPTDLRWVGDITRLDQRWNMFAPFPLIEDGWYVFPGQLVNGAEIDVFRNGTAVSYEKPKDVADLYSNQRWQKYLMNLWSRDNSSYRLYYGKYLCREWNGTHESGSQLQTFKMIFMLEKTEALRQPQTIIPTTIWEHKCF